MFSLGRIVVQVRYSVLFRKDRQPYPQPLLGFQVPLKGVKGQTRNFYNRNIKNTCRDVANVESKFFKKYADSSVTQLVAIVLLVTTLYVLSLYFCCYVISVSNWVLIIRFILDKNVVCDLSLLDKNVLVECVIAEHQVDMVFVEKM